MTVGKLVTYLLTHDQTAEATFYSTEEHIFIPIEDVKAITVVKGEDDEYRLYTNGLRIIGECDPQTIIVVV